MDRLLRIKELEDWHFWFVARRRMLDQMLDRYLQAWPASILDLGCGSGLTVQSLTARGHRVVGVDVLTEGLQATRQFLPGALLLQADITCLPLKENSFDAVLLLDVLEHVDDQIVLEHVQELLRPDGQVFLSVPTFPRVWSYRDEAAGHLRRYTYVSLLHLLNRTGFEVHDIRYFQFLFMPGLVITRWLGRRWPAWRDREESPHSVLNILMKGILCAEVWLSNWISWPWGSSLVAVCRKSQPHG